jgi:hypothetical protein
MRGDGESSLGNMAGTRGQSVQQAMISGSCGEMSSAGLPECGGSRRTGWHRDKLFGQSLQSQAVCRNAFNLAAFQDSGFSLESVVFLISSDHIASR